MSRKRFVWMLLALTVLSVTAATALVVMRTTFSYDLLTPEDVLRTRERSAWKGAWLARLGELVLPLLAPGDTEYAPGFNEDAFVAIKTGAREREVLERLGQPLDKKSFPEPIMRKVFPDGSTAWYYSRHGPRSKSFFVRALVFDGEGRVIRRFREYYID